MVYDAVIVGGGIVGLCNAYYLQKAGLNVAIVEEGEVAKACSFGNAGFLVPSHFVPLAAPGMIAKGMKWMFNPKSPFFLKPRLDTELFSWLWKFNAHCTKANVQKHQHFLKEISLYSKGLYQELYEGSDIDFSLSHKGLLVVCQERESLEEEAEMVEASHTLGMKAKLLSAKELEAKEPEANFNALGAALYEEDSQIMPYDFAMSLKKHLLHVGVGIFEHSKVERFLKEGATIKGVKTAKAELLAKNVVLCAGVFSQGLAKELGVSIPMQAGKGFSFFLENTPLKLNSPCILAEAKVAVSPYENKIRFGGTMMISGNELSIQESRVEAIKDAANRYFAGFDSRAYNAKNVWAGLRPCSPDGIPYVGKVSSYENVFVNCGHAMLGISLAPATAKVITDMLCGHKPSVQAQYMAVERMA